MLRRNIRIIGVIFISIICIPIALNYLCLTTFPAPIVGDGKLWLTFWGTYLGGIITVISAIYILYKEHQMECNRKEYEIQKEHFKSLCEDMGKLCSSIDIDMFSFYFMNLRDANNAIFAMTQIGSMDRRIRATYNEFCLKYAHEGGAEKEVLVEAYHRNASRIYDNISTLQDAIVKKLLGELDEHKYNALIQQVCDNLQALGDIVSEMYDLAEKWKKKEWHRAEFLRQKYTYA